MSIRPSPARRSVAATMREVLIALLPGIALEAWLFGPRVIATLLIAALACWLVEAVALRWRAQALRPFLSDLSAPVTGVLLGLALPPGSPWWLPVIGAVIAIGLAKHCYGGLGYNPFNPAMVAYAALLVSFPLPMTQWHSPAGVDAVSAATALDHVRTQLGLQRSLGEIRGDAPLGLLGAAGWEWVALAWLAGAVYLLGRRVIRWQIPAGVLLGIGLPALLFWAADVDRYASPLFHWFSGASLLGAFFIATDPVSAATTPRGRLYYGLGIGLLTWVIRSWGDYPDGLAFAVLLMNLCAPMIDRYTAPRVYGHATDGHDLNSSRDEP